MASEVAAPDDRPVLTVSELNRKVSQLLQAQPDLREIWVRGEVSNWRGPHHSSGHAYFRLKDDAAEINAVMWRGQVAGLTFEPEDGMEVLAKASPDLWEKAGKYQVQVKEMIQAGQGELYLQYQMLKKKLGEEGLFDEARKQPLPAFPRTIGVVTSKGAAAFQDLLNVLRRRSPHVQVLLSDAKVQGTGAAETVAAAIERLHRHHASGHQVDLIIVTRGGGSMEDLWAFNEEVAVRAVAEATLPTLVGVGHETDWTLCDLAADKRAPTPSAAAELAAPSREETLVMLDERGRQLAARLQQTLELKATHLDRLATRPVLSRPEALFAQAWQATDELATRLPRAMQGLVQQASSRLDALSQRPVLARPEALLREPARRVEELATRLPRGAHYHVERNQERLARLAGQLDAMSPLKVLSRGYSVAVHDGQAVTSIHHVEPGDEVDVRVQDGHVIAEVQETQEETR